MAVRAATIDRTVTRNGAAVLITWAALSNGDTGSPIMLSEFSDKTFQIIGTFGGGESVTIQGSNDGTNWTPLSNRQGTAMTFTALGMNTSQDRPIWVRPSMTAGTAVNMIVTAACHRSDIAEGG